MRGDFQKISARTAVCLPKPIAQVGPAPAAAAGWRLELFGYRLAGEQWRQLSYLPAPRRHRSRQVRLSMRPVREWHDTGQVAAMS